MRKFFGMIADWWSDFWYGNGIFYVLFAVLALCLALIFWGLSNVEPTTCFPTDSIRVIGVSDV